MAEPFRLKGYSRKPTAGPLPRLPCDYRLVIDLDGVPKVYFEFWREKTFGRNESGWVQKTALDALSTDYFFHAEHEPVPVRDLPYACTGVLANDSIEPACLTLLQLGIKAQLQILVRDHGKTSFTISTSSPAMHVLSHYFPGLHGIPTKVVAKVARGKLYRPRVLTRLTLPALPGVGGAGPSQLPLVAPDPIQPGAIVLGEVVSPLTGQAIGAAWIHRDVMARGTLVAGMTGGGKTTTVQHLVQQVREHAWVLCLEPKREYRSLHATADAQVFGFSGANILSHNLLKPEGPPSLWIKQFADILAQVINLYAPAVGSKDVVIEEMDGLFRKRGVYDGSANYPHIGDLVQALEARAENRSAAREGGWIASALRVLRSLQIGSTGTAFCVREGLSLNRLLSGVTVVELDGLGDKAAASLLVSVLLQKIRNHYADQPPAERLRGLFIVEEAQNFLAQGQESTSVLATTCREIRSFGIGLVYVTQMPSEFSKNAMANVNTIIAHKLVYPADKSMMANMLGLDTGQREILENLRVGDALLKSDRLTQIRVPNVARPVVRDDQLRAPIVEREAVSTSHAQRGDVAARIANLPPHALDTLQTIAESTAIHQTGISQALGVSGKDACHFLSLLLNRGLVGCCRAERGTRGRPPSFYFLRPFGEEAYRQRFGRYADRGTEPSAKHKGVLETVLQKLRVERKPHKKFDILFDEGGVDRAIEVETGSNNNAQILENLRKSLEFQQEARFVAADEGTKNRVLQVAAKEAFDTRRPILLRVALVTGLDSWESWTLEPVPITT